MSRKLVNIQNSPVQYHVRDWITYLKASGLSAKSVDIYQYYIHCFAYWWREQRAETEIDKFSSRDCTAFMAYLAEPNRARWGEQNNSKSQDTLSDSSRRLIITIVKAFFLWLEDEKILRETPWARTKVKIKIDSSRPVRALTPEEIRLIFDWLENPNVKRRREYNRVRDLALIALMFDTGTRRQEVANLTLDDLRVENGRVFIRKGKGGKPREVPFGGSTKKLLTDYLEKYRLPQGSEIAALWLTHDGAPLLADSLKSVLDRIRKATGIKHFHPHALRHTFATTLVQRVGIYDVSRLLGHESVKQTERYSRHNPEAAAAAYSGNSPMSIMGITPVGKRRPGRPRKYQE